MKPIRLHLIGLSENDRQTTLYAARLLQPPAQASDVATVDHVVAMAESGGLEILVLGAEIALGAAADATTAAGAPRFGTIRVGAADGASHLGEVAADGWTAASAPAFLRAAARLLWLERQNASLRGDLATVGRRISHDLRAPLSAIISSAEVLRETLEGKAPESVPFTRALTDAVSEQERTIRRVSFVLKASTQAEVLQEVAMIEPLHAAIQRNEVRAAATGAKISLAADWPTVRGVSSWLEALWTELIQNAIEHAKEREVAVRLGWTHQGESIQFWVHNTGSSIPPAKVRFFFHAFDQLHRLDAPRGLGLPIVRRLAEISGGTAGYEPQEDGARFFFTLAA